MRRGSSGISIRRAGKFIDSKSAMDKIRWPVDPHLLWYGHVVGEYMQDESGNGYHGYLNGPVVQRGFLGDCIYVDGSNDTCAVDSVPISLDEISIVMLVNSQSLPDAWDSAFAISLDGNNYVNLTCRGIAIRPYVVIAGDNYSLSHDIIAPRSCWELWQIDLSKSGSFRRMYINNILAYNIADYPGKATANYTVTVGNKMKMLLGALAVYQRVLTDAERKDLYLQFFPDRRGDLVLFEGDSLTGPSDSWSCYPFQLMSDHVGRYINHGTTGDTVYSDMIGDGAAIDALQVDDGQNVIVVLGGTNDLAGGRTVQQTYDAIEAFCAARQASGWTVLVLTIPNRTGSTTNQDVNLLIKAGYSGFADAICDVAAEANLSDPTNLTYFQEDGIHLTTAGYGVVEAAVAIELEKIWWGGVRY